MSEQIPESSAGLWRSCRFLTGATGKLSGLLFVPFLLGAALGTAAAAAEFDGAAGPAAGAAHPIQVAADRGDESWRRFSLFPTGDHGAAARGFPQVAASSAEADEEDEEDIYLEAEEAHEKLFSESRYPSAATCGTCHPKHYKEWSVSQHAYAQLSPVYMAINNFLNFSTSSSMGDFCLRCHNQVGANIGESPFISNLERHPTSREGITCVVCHRTSKAYNKASGRIGLEEGDLLAPVYGPMGNEELSRVLKDNDYRVVTERDEIGRKIHTEAKQFKAISTPTFCGSCHDVTLFNGFRLEEAFSEYRMSPAAARGETCQDCHMGKVQGIASGYDTGPAAIVGGVATRKRKITNHLFSGPDYSVIHPGIFPHNSDAQKMASLRQWLQFDHKAGWGTDAFEDELSEDKKFPPRWESVDDRYDARDILDEQFEQLAFARQKRLELLRNGYGLGAVVVEQQGEDGIEFKVQVKNLTDGHNAPTGFTGERLVWLEVTVTDRAGKVVFRSGDRDPNGDLRDLHSRYVHDGKLPIDNYLLSLQSKFVVQQGRGGEREAVIPIPYTVTALPIVRPSTLSLILTGEPTTERNHRMSIEPKGERWANYEVPGEALTGKGPYKAVIRLNAQMIPVNLIAAVERVGFDYGMSARSLADAVVAGSEVLRETWVTFNIDEK